MIRFREKNQEYEAIAKVYIKDMDGHIPDVMQDNSVYFCDEPLWPGWGFESDERPGYRRETITFRSKSIEELQKLVRNGIEGEIGKIKRVVRDNVSSNLKLPEPEHYEFII